MGAHFLVDQELISELVRGSGVGTGDLVFDLGAGYGALTGPLVRTGARVIAIELDPALVGRLERRFGAEPGVGVVAADLRWVPLPRRPFRVVANPPFALTTLLCRRLLGDPLVKLASADLVLELGAARRLAAARPAASGPTARLPEVGSAAARLATVRGSAARLPAARRSAARPPPAPSAASELARWAARYQIDLIRPIPAAAFSPPPASDAAYVRIRPKLH